MKTLKEKHTLLTWMMCMAVKACKLEFETLDYEEGDIEFSDPLTRVQGSISLNDDETYRLFLMDETLDCPSKYTMDAFKVEYMDDNSSFFIDGSNYLLYFYDDIPITNSTSIVAFQAMITKAIINVIRFRSILEEIDDEEE
ncbi:MAG: hypothetical protein K5979_00180 [Ruminococcus sp.]|nr:hypothetical protein [Ruminococcus sp.]